MNAYREKHLADIAVYGAKRVQDYCEYRKGQCHIEGLPDCPFIVKTTGKGSFEFEAYAVYKPTRWLTEQL